MGKEKRTYTIHKSKANQDDRKLMARPGLRRNLDKTSCRVETIGELNGVVFINDSRAEDLLATRDTFKYIMKPMVWIAATSHLERDYALLEKFLEHKVKAIVTYGANFNDMQGKLMRFVDEFKRSEKLEEALALAAGIAVKDDAIVYSPSCKARDGYVNFYDRGNAFKRFLEELKNK